MAERVAEVRVEGVVVGEVPVGQHHVAELRFDVPAADVVHVLTLHREDEQQLRQRAGEEHAWQSEVVECRVARDVVDECLRRELRVRRVAHPGRREREHRVRGEPPISGAEEAGDEPTS